jgi:hypothetical protein
VTKFSDRGIEPLRLIHEKIRRPELRNQLLARDHFTGAHQQRPQYDKAVALQSAPLTVFAQFSGIQVKLETSESNATARR